MTFKDWTTADLPDQTGRTVIITGANSGLGAVTARELARVGARVVLAVRDKGRGEAAAATMTGRVEVLRLDLADLASVRAFADAWADPVDILINNAGVMAIPKRRTADGFEMQIGTNHLGHFVLSNLLLPKITDRVVTLASNFHRGATMDLDDLNSDISYDRWRAYGRSKLANLLFTLELHRRLDAIGSAVEAHAAHPGWSATNLQGNTTNRFERAAMAFGNRLLAQPDTMGALPTLYAATQHIPGNSYIGPDGFREFRGHPAPAKRSAAASDGDTARRLWRLSEKVTGVAFPSLSAGR